MRNKTMLGLYIACQESERFAVDKHIHKYPGKKSVRHNRHISLRIRELDVHLHQENEPINPYKKNLSRVMPPRLPIPAYCWEWRVLNRAQFTRLIGQIMDGGATRNRRATPPIENPMSWVDITTNHWSMGFLTLRKISKGVYSIAYS